MNEIVPADRRAQVTSTYYLITFVGNSLPVIGVGIVTTAASASPYLPCRVPGPQVIRLLAAECA